MLDDVSEMYFSASSPTTQARGSGIGVTALEVGFRLEGTLGSKRPWFCRGHLEKLRVSLRGQCPLTGLALPTDRGWTTWLTKSFVT